MEQGEDQFQSYSIQNKFKLPHSQTVLSLVRF